ncbi:MAG: pyruvate kinase [Acidobacteria bacterium]|nr:MAG: pyruvate kinase [Acidobacteriota bacterium]
MERRAKIMATLGPVSRDETVLRGLVRAGVDLFRLNLSHGTQEQHRETLRRVRRVAGEENCHLPVVLDLMGPRYRLGLIPDEPRLLKPNQEVVLGREEQHADLPVDPEILEHLQPEERVLIDSGLIELRVESKQGDRVQARVVNGGPIKTRKGINLPDTDLPFEVSEKDRSDIAFAVAEEADYLAASYVGAASHVEAIREVVSAAGGRIPIIAKIERKTAIEKLDEITVAADGLMVARGDLGVEVPLYTVPVLQKKIVAAGRLSGKPVIVATQMLESMIEQPRPTRAEATDVANAVFDGADVLMLSGETAAGKYPVLVVETMARIIQEAEDYVRQNNEPPKLQPLGPVHTRRTYTLDSVDPTGAGTDVTDIVSAAAVYAAGQIGVRRIVAFSQSGFTARLVARYRPPSPIMAFTPDARVARQIQLIWGVRPFVAEFQVGSLEDIVNVVERELLAAKLVVPGDRIIILMGHPVRERPLANLLRVHLIRQL